MAACGAAGEVSVMADLYGDRGAGWEGASSICRRRRTRQPKFTPSSGFRRTKRSQSDRDATTRRQRRATCVAAARHWRDACAPRRRRGRDRIAPATRHLMAPRGARVGGRDRGRRDRSGVRREAPARWSRPGRMACPRAVDAGDARWTATCPPTSQRGRRCRCQAARQERRAACAASSGRGRDGRTPRVRRADWGRGAVPSDRVDQKSRV